jgi:import inner membrane translocase subunit TIM9
MQRGRMSKDDEASISQMMERMQMEDIITHFNRLADTCFTQCVGDFKSNALLQNEEVCVQRCVEKFTQFSTRFQRVFVDHQTAANKQRQ